jgi:hypothetical protein
MLLKINMPDVPDGCGVKMPSGKTINADEIACLTQIINAVAALK